MAHFHPVKPFAVGRDHRPPSTPSERLKSTLLGHSASHSERLFLVESECGAVAVGRTYLLPPLSSGGASLVRPWLRFHTHRVTGGGRPPPVPTERGVRISRTNALRQLLHSTSLLFVQVSFPWSADLLFE